MNIKITGTKGYIVENLFPYLIESISDSDIETITVREGKIDFTDTDILIHVAGVVPGKVKDNLEYYKINYELTKKLAMKAKLAGVKQMIYFSTIAVYGRVPLLKKTVSFEEGTEQPATPYGDSKLQAERFLRELETEQFKVAILRVPDVYGQQSIDYLQRYINIAQKYYKIGGFNPIVWNNNKRSAVHIDNLVSCVKYVIKEEWSGIMIPHDKDPLSTCEYIQLISEVRNIKLKASKLFGWGVWFLEHFIRKLEFFYGSFNASMDLKVPFSYQVMSATEACKLALKK